MAAKKKCADVKAAVNFSIASNVIVGILILLIGGIFMWKNFLAAAELPVEKSKLVKEIRERVVANADTIIAEVAV